MPKASTPSTAAKKPATRSRRPSTKKQAEAVKQKLNGKSSEAVESKEVEVLPAKGSKSTKATQKLDTRYAISPTSITLDGQEYTVELYSELAFNAVSEIYSYLVAKRSAPTGKEISNVLFYSKEQIIPDVKDEYIWSTPRHFYAFTQNLAHLMAFFVTLWYWYVTYQLDDEARKKFFKPGSGVVNKDQVISEYYGFINGFESINYQTMVVVESELLKEMRDATVES